MMPKTGGGHLQRGNPGRSLIAVGRLTRPVGLKGELAVDVLTENRDRLQSIESAWVGATPGEARLHRMEHVRLSPAAVIVKLSDVDSRTHAETYRGQYVFVDEKESPGPGPGSYYVHELIGLEVVDEQGTHLGTISDVRRFPAQDLWVVARGGREILVPAVKEFIRSVELERRRVIVRPIEGLFDEN